MELLSKDPQESFCQNKAKVARTKTLNTECFQLHLQLSISLCNQSTSSYMK